MTGRYSGVYGMLRQQMRRTRYYRGAFLVALGLVLSTTVAAAQDPLAIIRSRNVAVKQVLDRSSDTVSAATKERLKDIINGFIDFDELSRQALGKHWEQRTPAERSEFIDVFRQLVRNSSVKKLEVYKADRIEYEPAKITGSDARVTTIAYKDAKAVEIVYRMRQHEGKWTVFDVTIDGASTVRTYRDSFYKQLERASFREMLDKLIRRLNDDT